MNQKLAKVTTRVIVSVGYVLVITVFIISIIIIILFLIITYCFCRGGLYLTAVFLLSSILGWILCWTGAISVNCDLLIDYAHYTLKVPLHFSDSK